MTQEIARIWQAEARTQETKHLIRDIKRITHRKFTAGTNEQPVRAGRYKRVGDDENHPKYLVLYEFENKEAMEVFDSSPELIAAMKDLEETWKDGRIELQWVVSYEPIKIWERE
jgi:hypothetical protein